MSAGAAATTSRLRDNKEIPSSNINIDRQFHYQDIHLATQLNSPSQQHQQHQQQQPQQSTKSSRLLCSSVSTSVEPQGSSSGSICSSTNLNRRNKISHTRFTSHVNPMSPTTASSVVASHIPVMPPPLPMQDKTDIFHLHHIDQTHSSSSSSINAIVSSSLNTINSQHMKSLQGQPQQQQHYQMLRDRHKEDMILPNKIDYATSSFTNVDDLTNAIRNKVIVEEDEEDILSSDNTYLY